MEDKKVKDLMLSLDEYATIASNSTIQEALQALNKAQLGLTYDRHHHRAILVFDPEGGVVGKLTHLSILRSLEPRFLRNGDMHPLARAGLTEEFIKSVEANYRHFSMSLERLCSEAARLRVEDATVTVFEHIDEDALLTEAIQRIVDAHVQSMLVTRNRKVVGILRTSDVFEEVADIIRESGEQRD